MMNKLKYEQAVAENCKRVVARTNVADEVKSSKTRLIRDKFEMEKKTPSKAGAQRDPTVNSDKKSERQSNFDAVKPSRPTIRRMVSHQVKTMSIPVRQENVLERGVEENASLRETPKLIKRNTICELLSTSKNVDDTPISFKDLKESLIQDDTSHETAMIKLPENNSEDFSAPTVISKPENNVSDTSPYDCDEYIQNDQLDDEPNLKDNELMLPEVNPNHGSGEVGNGNSYFETEEPIINDTYEYSEYVDEDTPRVLEVSNDTLISEPDNDLVSPCLEAESFVLMEELQDPIVAEFSEENIENSELQTSSSNNAVPVLDSNQEKIESTKLLRAHFEAFQNNPPTDRPIPKSNRTSQLFNSQVIIKCEFCEKKVYPLEKIEIEGRVYHKTCFRCSHCQCLLRMDSFTRNRNRLYCMPHFKQLFKTSGNYDQGFIDA